MYSFYTVKLQQTLQGDQIDCRKVMKNTATREINKKPDQLKMTFFSSYHCPSVHNRSARLHVLLFSCLWILRHLRASSSLSDSSEVWTTAFERWGMNFRHGKGHRPLDYDSCGPALPHFVTAKKQTLRPSAEKTHKPSAPRGEPVFHFKYFLKKALFILV